VLGLAGALLGLSSAGVTFDPTGGDLASDDSLADLAVTLVGYQLSTGGFSWSSQALGEGESNETIQETAYSLLALNELDRSGYLTEIGQAGSYMIVVQLGTGGWENYAASGENNEITGEAMWGIANIPEPTTALLLAMGLGGMALLGRRSR
jgi:hypothetical protein